MSLDRTHIVIAGGGVAAVETLLALRELAGHRIEITLVAP
jgi:sulfide:quinone oxidoreductase